MYCRLGLPEPVAGFRPGAQRVASAGRSALSTVIAVWLIKLLFCGIALMTCPADGPLCVIGSAYGVPLWRCQVEPLSVDLANMMFEFVCHAGLARHVQLISNSPHEVSASVLM